MIIDLTDKIEIKEKWEDQEKVIELICKEPLILTSYKIKGMAHFYNYYHNDNFSPPIGCNIKFTNNETTYQLDDFQMQDGYSVFEKAFQLKNTQKRKIKYIKLKYDPTVTSAIADGQAFIEKEMFIEEVRVFREVIGINTGLRIRGLNNHIYNILDAQNNSPLKINTSTGVKNIKLISADNSANSKLRVKTKDGTMAIAIEEA